MGYLLGVRAATIFMAGLYIMCLDDINFILGGICLMVAGASDFIVSLIKEEKLKKPQKDIVSDNQ